MTAALARPQVEPANVERHVERIAATLLATLVAQPALVAEVPALESADWPAFEQQAVWRAIRTIETRGEAVTVDAIDSQQVTFDGERETVLRVKAGRDYLTELQRNASQAPPDALPAMVRGWAAVLQRARLDRESAIKDATRAEQEDFELDDLALRDAEAPPPKVPWHRCPDLVEVIMAHAKDVWASLTLGGEEITTCRPGGVVVVMGPTGAMKTSLVCGLTVEHARHHGPAIWLSRELPADELAARMIGMQCDASWGATLTGQVMRSDMERALALPRMTILDRTNATLANLVAAIQAARAECPGQPIVVAIDYIQIIPSLERDARAKVADVIAQVDEIARAYGVVVLAISQMSRAASRAARNGEAVGADSTDGGAESAAIERAASVTLSIGSSGPEREDGTKAVDLSIGKGRMTGGDRVLPMSACGKSGRWRVAGEARPAAEVRAEREGQRDSAKQRTAELAIVAAAERAAEPQTREDLAAAVAGYGNDIRRAAVAALLARGEIVEVQQRSPRSRVWKLWTRGRAEAAGLAIVATAATAAGLSPECRPAPVTDCRPPIVVGGSHSVGDSEVREAKNPGGSRGPTGKAQAALDIDSPPACGTCESCANGDPCETGWDV